MDTAESGGRVTLPDPETPDPVPDHLAPEVAVQLLAALPGPVLLLDAAGRVVWANPAAVHLASQRPVGRRLESCGLLADPSALGRRTDAPGWTGGRLLGWTDTPLPDGRLLVTGTDHTVRHEASEDLRIAAVTDPLTGLPNRAGLLAALERSLEGDQPVVVLFCDLDGFKAVNDDHGHATGDLLLRAVADRLVKGVRGGDVVGRLGGDEFVVISPGLDPEHAPRMVHRLVANVAQPLVLAEGVFCVGVSIGLAVGQPGTEVTTLLAQADGEMYRRKSWRVAARRRSPVSA